MELDADFLKWEYATAARAETLWTISALPLVRAADGLWARAEGFRRLWAEAFALAPDGSIANTERRLSAEELEVLHDQGLDRVALMLLGFSLENVAKTLLVASKPQLVSDEGSVQLKTHDLVGLFRRCNVELTADQVLHLNILRDYLEWMGRYPVPISATGKGSPKSVPGAWVRQRLPDSRDTWTVGRALLQRIVDERDQSMFRDPLSNER